jgi:hypothetical protein
MAATLPSRATIKQQNPCSTDIDAEAKELMYVELHFFITISSIGRTSTTRARLVMYGEHQTG